MDVNSTLIITSCSQSYFRYKSFPQQAFVIFVVILSGYSFAMSRASADQAENSLEGNL